MAAVDTAPRHSEEQRKAFREAGFWDDATLTDRLRHWAEKTPDAPAIRTPDMIMSYAELYAAARRLANSLLGLGLRRQDVIGIQMPNEPEYLISLFGVMAMIVRTAR